MYNNILVPIDGSKNAQEAVNVAIKLAKTFEAKLNVVSVATDQRYVQYGVTLGTDVMDSFESAANKILYQAKKDVEAADVPVETHFVIGSPKMQIAEKLPVDLNTDLTIIGKSGMNGISRALLGSTTEYVVRHSPTDVIVIENKEN